MKRVFRALFTCATVLLISLSLSSFAKAIDYDGQLAAQLSVMDKNSHYRGGFRNDNKVNAASDKLNELLLRFANSAEFFASPLNKSQDRGLSIAKSAESKLRAFSWDNLTGGSAHYFNTVFQFEGKSGKLFGVARAQNRVFALKTLLESSKPLTRVLLVYGMGKQCGIQNLWRFSPRG